MQGGAHTKSAHKGCTYRGYTGKRLQKHELKQAYAGVRSIKQARLQPLEAHKFPLHFDNGPWHSRPHHGSALVNGSN
eukprot:scaffold11014_cov24-Tisochrysis_lutea.AAC.2